MQINLDPADPARLLKLPKVKIRAEKSFRLPENSSDNVGLFNYSFNVKLRLRNVLYRKRLG
jgi:hypothetical protein